MLRQRLATARAYTRAALQEIENALELLDYADEEIAVSFSKRAGTDLVLAQHDLLKAQEKPKP